jgi:hypothetical protein
MCQYKIIRFYFNSNINTRTIKTGLTLEEAKAYCSSPESSSKTATSSAARARTSKLGPWFDGYTEQ